VAGATKVDDYQPPTWPNADQPKQMHVDLAVDDLAKAEAEAVAPRSEEGRFSAGTRRWVVLLDPAVIPSA